MLLFIVSENGGNGEGEMLFISLGGESGDGEGDESLLPGEGVPSLDCSKVGHTATA